MLRHSNNAIIITSVQGEGGPQGFRGADGQACYEGTGDPNTLSLTPPSYSDPVGFTRGIEDFYYQDTVTGDVWTARLAGGQFTTWTKNGVNVKGAQGDRGPADYSKVEINLGVNKPYKEITIGSGSGIFIKKISNFIFPGTDAGTYTDIKVLAMHTGTSNITTTFYIKDSAGTEIASGSFSSRGLIVPEVVDLSLTGTWPVTEEYLYLETRTQESILAGSDNKLKLYYLLIN